MSRLQVLLGTQVPQLRNKIWRLFAASSEPREIHLARLNTEYLGEQPDPPAILQVAHEARLEGMKHYTPCREFKPVIGGEISDCPSPIDSCAYYVACWKLARIAHRTVWINLDLDCLIYTSHCNYYIGENMAGFVIAKAFSILRLYDNFYFREDVLSQIKNVTIKTPNQGFIWEFMNGLTHLKGKTNIHWLIKVDRYSIGNRYGPFKSDLRLMGIEDYLSKDLSNRLTNDGWFFVNYRLEFPYID